MALTPIQLRNQAFMEKYTEMNYEGRGTNTQVHSKNLSEIGTYRANGFAYVPMDASKVFNYHEPEMSEEEYEQAIIAMAKEDAANDLAKGKDCYDSFRKSKNYSKLQRSFLQCVSPDRIGIVNNTLAKNGGIMKNNRFYNSKTS